MILKFHVTLPKTKITPTNWCFANRNLQNSRGLNIFRGELSVGMTSGRGRVASGMGDFISSLKAGGDPVILGETPAVDVGR